MTSDGLPDFMLPDYAGGNVSSRELGGKVVLVTFLDSQCTGSCPIIASQVARVHAGADLTTENWRTTSASHPAVERLERVTN